MKPKLPIDRDGFDLLPKPIDWRPYVKGFLIEDGCDDPCPTCGKPDEDMLVDYRPDGIAYCECPPPPSPPVCRVSLEILEAGKPVQIVAAVPGQSVHVHGIDLTVGQNGEIAGMATYSLSGPPERAARTEPVTTGVPPESPAGDDSAGPVSSSTAGVLPDASLPPAEILAEPAGGGVDSSSEGRGGGSEQTGNPSPGVAAASDFGLTEEEIDLLVVVRDSGDPWRARSVLMEESAIAVAAPLKRRIAELESLDAKRLDYTHQQGNEIVRLKADRDKARNVMFEVIQSCATDTAAAIQRANDVQADRDALKATISLHGALMRNATGELDAAKTEIVRLSALLMKSQDDARVLRAALAESVEALRPFLPTVPINDFIPDSEYSLVYSKTGDLRRAAEIVRRHAT